MFELDYLHREIAKICPIYGISQNGDVISIVYHEKASDEQKRLAETYLKKFQWNDDMEKAEAGRCKVNQYKDDLSIKAGYVQYKIQNPNATYLEFLNYLESLNVT